MSYEMRFRDGISDGGSSNLHGGRRVSLRHQQLADVVSKVAGTRRRDEGVDIAPFLRPHIAEQVGADRAGLRLHRVAIFLVQLGSDIGVERHVERLHFLPQPRSEEHTSELPSLMRISYADFCLKKKKQTC